MPVGHFFPKQITEQWPHTVLILLHVQAHFLALVVPCSFTAPQNHFNLTLNPLQCLADWNPLPLSKKKDNMISLFALLSIICGTKCLQIVEVCAQSKQHYQGLLSWGPLCQELVKSHCNNSPWSQSTFVPSWLRLNNLTKSYAIISADSLGKYYSRLK